MDILAKLVRNSLTSIEKQRLLHEGAAGIGIKDSNVDAFIKYSNKALKNINLGEKSYLVDFEFGPGELSNLSSACEELDSIKRIYGKGIEEPHIIVKNIIFKPSDLTVMGADKSSAKIVSDGVSFVKFKDKDFIQEAQKYALGAITIYGRMNLNEFCGNVTPQVFIDDYEIKNARALF